MHARHPGAARIAAARCAHAIRLHAAAPAARRAREADRRDPLQHAHPPVPFHASLLEGDDARAARCTARGARRAAAGTPGSTVDRTPRCRPRRSRRAERRRRPAPRAVHRAAAGAGSWRRRRPRSVRGRAARRRFRDRPRASRTPATPRQRREGAVVAVDRQHAMPEAGEEARVSPRRRRRGRAPARPVPSARRSDRSRAKAAGSPQGTWGRQACDSGGGRVGRVAEARKHSNGRSRRPAPAPHGAHPGRKTDTGAARRYPRVQSRAA